MLEFIRRLLHEIQAVNVRLDILTHQGKKIMSILEDLTAAVAAETSVAASAITLIKGLEQKLSDAGIDEVKLVALRDSLHASASALAAALQATPAAPPAPAPHVDPPAPPPVDPHAV